jgi:hypothetical protein
VTALLLSKYRSEWTAIRAPSAGGTTVEHTSVFETVILSRSDLVHWPVILNKVRNLVESSDIKIVDIQRDKEQLIIVFRRRS